MELVKQLESLTMPILVLEHPMLQLLSALILNQAVINHFLFLFLILLLLNHVISHLTVILERELLKNLLFFMELHLIILLQLTKKSFMEQLYSLLSIKNRPLGLLLL
jgi:hypothetical protein